ncbi:MAG TPA: FAD-dependent oxidoreductase [Bryobacteraceae bacterium]|nr:FAD-dependent oxidoreductase [Bryobacteraceae bacterium]
MPVDPSVLISGAGPTGLALACDLARRGVPFRIMDKTDAYFNGSRGKGLQPRSLEILDDFGVIDQILANGRSHLPFRAYSGTKILGDRDIHEGRVPTPDVPYASSLIIPQWRVEEILRNRLQGFGHTVELGTELVGFDDDGRRVAATLNRGSIQEKVVCQYLVGADGGHSFVRHALNVGFEGEAWPTERMLVGDVKADTLDRDHWHSWQNNELGWMALCPLPSTDSFQFQAGIGPDEPDQPSLERFQQIVDQRTGGFGIHLSDATWLSLYRANVRMVDRYRVGRVFLAGDAAHVHSPAGGQGMNTGIQDAYNLGWKLAMVLNGASERLLDTYEAERLPVAAWMIGVTTKLHRQITANAEVAQKRGPETLQLGITYRDGPLARDERASPGSLRAGDRAPDAPCQKADGTPVRFFDLFRGPHFTLLTFGNSPTDPTEPEVANGSLVSAYTVAQPGEAIGDSAIVDVAGHGRRAYDVGTGVQILVRPDGYIGLITQERSGRAVDGYLKRLTT